MSGQASRNDSTAFRIVRVCVGAIASLLLVAYVSRFLEVATGVSIGSITPADSKIFIAADPLWARLLIYLAGALVAAIVGAVMAGPDMGLALTIGLGFWVAGNEDESAGSGTARILYMAMFIGLIGLAWLGSSIARRRRTRREQVHQVPSRPDGLRASN